MLFTSDVPSYLQIPKEYIPGVTKGLEEMMTSGALAGFPVVDLVATLYDGSYHDVDSSVLAFQIAARQAFRWNSRLTHKILLFQSHTFKACFCGLKSLPKLCDSLWTIIMVVLSDWLTHGFLDYFDKGPGVFSCLLLGRNT